LRILEMAVRMGIDIGSGFSKAVLYDGNDMRIYVSLPSGGDYKKTARHIANIVLEQAGMSIEEIPFIIATGYGANMVDFATGTATDITCHALAIHKLFPSARIVIDIGHQFSKAISLNEQGRVTNFLLNEKCAGGSGKFLQIIAKMLHIRVEEIGERSSDSKKPVEFTTGCAVFAESEAVSRIAEGAKIEDILAGVHKAMASKIVNLITRLGTDGDCVITGGGAMDRGLTKIIEQELGSKIIVPENPQATGAYGAALITCSF